MPRGGSRTGTPGKAYPARTDLTPVAAPDQTYGQAGAQIAAQQAVPMGAQPTAGPAQGEGAGPAVQPGSLGPLNAPSNRPDEPLTQGSPMGAGAGPELFTPPPSPLLTSLALLNSLGDELPPQLRQTVMALQASQDNGRNG